MEGNVQFITLGGAEYAIVPRREYEQLVDGKAPAKEDAGTVSAVEAGREILGQSLRKARETAGLTQVELASRLKKSQTMVNGAESGRVRVGAAYVKAVLAACGLPANWTAPQKGTRPARGTYRASKATMPKSKAPPGRSRRAGG